MYIVSLKYCFPFIVKSNLQLIKSVTEIQLSIVLSILLNVVDKFWN